MSRLTNRPNAEFVLICIKSFSYFFSMWKFRTLTIKTNCTEVNTSDFIKVGQNDVYELSELFDNIFKNTGHD